MRAPLADAADHAIQALVSGSARSMGTPEQTLKVLMIENGRGGYSRYTRDLCAALPAQGCDVVYLASLDHEIPVEGDVRLLLYPHTPVEGPTGKYGFVSRKIISSLCNFVRIRRFAGRFEPDLIHFQLATPLADAHWLPILRRRWPVVLTAHDVIPHHGHRLLSSPSNLKRLYRSVDRVIVHSAVNRATIVHHFALPGDRIAVIPHGTDAAIPAVPASVARRTLDLPEDEHIVLFLGVIRSNKRLDLLIEACAKLFARQAGIRLVIAGRPQDVPEAQVRRMLSEGGIAERTTTRFGWIPDDALELYLDAADVCVLPYVNFHAQSGVLMRALAHGTPTIVADGGSLAVVVTEGEAGLIFPAGDAAAMADRIETVLASETLRSRLGRNAQRMARNQFDWRIVAAETSRMYRQLVADSTNGGRGRIRPRQ
jgi:glycosyltransferase involved in cell wall biosynthesis